MNAVLEHLIVLPVVVPLLTAAIMLFLPESARRTRVTLALASVSAQLLMSVALLFLTSDAAHFIWPEGVGVYAMGNWNAPFGIVLVVDRLAAVMLALSSTVALTTLTYSVARWDRPGQPFHSLFQLLTMGVNGAFLTGDLFNLFVFFEVLLAASYGLVLHGDGIVRVKAGLAYIAINLTGSFLFLMAAAASILGTAFLMKAGAWPLNFWLPTTYAAASAPAAAVFAIMSKLGVYVILRLWTLVLGPEAGPLAGFGGAWLLVGGMLTIAFGTVGVLASQSLP